LQSLIHSAINPKRVSWFNNSLINWLNFCYNYRLQFDCIHHQSLILHGSLCWLIESSFLMISWFRVFSVWIANNYHHHVSIKFVHQKVWVSFLVIGLSFKIKWPNDQRRKSKRFLFFLNQAVDEERKQGHSEAKSLVSGQVRGYSLEQWAAFRGQYQSAGSTDIWFIKTNAHTK